MDWDKTDIIHFLSLLRGYRSYLEICTASTGNRYAKINQSRFDVCHRLMYRCGDDFSDGLKIDFRSSDLDITRCVEDINRSGFRYDVILVDPFHDYASSFRDLKVALDLVTDGGSIVVHDCLPPTENIISPEFVPGSWCGVTFIAYLDFVMENEAVAYRTIDTDFGCGIIQTGDTLSNPNHARLFRDRWNAAKRDPIEAFRFMQKFRFTLLRVQPVDSFIRAEAERALTRGLMQSQEIRP